MSCRFSGTNGNQEVGAGWRRFSNAEGVRRHPDAPGAPLIECDLADPSAVVVDGSTQLDDPDAPVWRYRLDGPGKGIEGERLPLLILRRGIGLEGPDLDLGPLAKVRRRRLDCHLECNGCHRGQGSQSKDAASRAKSADCRSRLSQARRSTCSFTQRIPNARGHVWAIELTERISRRRLPRARRPCRSGCSSVGTGAAPRRSARFGAWPPWP